MIDPNQGNRPLDDVTALAIATRLDARHLATVLSNAMLELSALDASRRARIELFALSRGTGKHTLVAVGAPYVGLAHGTTVFEIESRTFTPATLGASRSVASGSAVEHVIREARAVALVSGAGDAARQAWLRAEERGGAAVVLLPLRDMQRTHAYSVCGLLKIAYSGGDCDEATLRALAGVLVDNEWQAISMLVSAVLLLDTAVAHCVESQATVTRVPSPPPKPQVATIVEAGSGAVDSEDKVVVLMHTGMSSGSCAYNADVRAQTIKDTTPARQLFARTAPLTRGRAWPAHDWTGYGCGSGRVVAHTAAYAVVDAYTPWAATQAIPGAEWLACPRLPDHAVLLACLHYDARDFFENAAGLLRQLEQCDHEHARCRHVLIFSMCAPPPGELAQMASVNAMLRPWRWWRTTTTRPPLVLTTVGSHLSLVQMNALQAVCGGDDDTFRRLVRQQRERRPPTPTNN
jgi:hypothetical protein